MAAAPADWRGAALWLLACAGVAAALGTVAGSTAWAADGSGVHAVHLLLMLAVPWGLSPRVGRHFIAATAAGLLLIEALLHLTPTESANGAGDAQAQVGVPLLIAAAAALLAHRRLRHQRACAPQRPSSAASSPPVHGLRQAPVLALALLAGLSTGALARMDLLGLCGPGSATPGSAAWLLSLAGVLAGAWLIERGALVAVLGVLFGLRAGVLIALGTADAELASLAPALAQLLRAVDCLTLPALMHLAGRHCRLPGFAGPGLAHHAGMALGAALATAPRFFFGEAFAALAFCGSALSLLCILGLWAWQRTVPTSPLPPSARLLP